MGETSEILKVFRGSRILVTGGTGFMGQMLMEKLLRSCQIEKLYMLTRPKKDLTEKERLDKLLESYLFQTLQPQYSQQELLNKIVLVSGNLEEKGLGLKEEDRAMLIREVDLIFHSGATVRFDAKLWTALATNVLATKDLLDMAREMPQLKAFVHISTAYAFCPRKEIGEEIYQPSIGWREMVHLVDSLDHDTIETITPVLLGEWPNTYTFTKAIAEDTVREYGKDLPIALVRPAIVISTAKEPVVGWINNVYGATGVVIGAGLGLLRTMHCDQDILAELVPADLSINMMIAAAWNVATTHRLKKERLAESPEEEDCSDILILNNVSSTENPITWGQYMKYNENGIDYPSMKCVWYYCFQLNKYRFMHNLCAIFLHFLPAIIVDTAARLVGKKPILWNAYKKIHKFVDVIAYFSTQRWKFTNPNVQKMVERMNPADQELFDFNIGGLNWKKVFLDSILGLRLHMAHDPPNTVEAAKNRYKRVETSTLCSCLHNLLYNAWLHHTVVLCVVM